MTEQTLPEENFWLSWILENRKLVSISALESYIGIPYQTIHRYLQTGKFPPDHLTRLQEKMGRLIKIETAFCLRYINNLISQRQAIVLEMGEWELGSPGQLVASAKQEQILEDLITLYCTAVEDFPDLQEFLHTLIAPVAGHSFDEMCAAQRQLRQKASTAKLTGAMSETFPKGK